ncbi:MAG: hypothetical protein K5764_02445 [Prevotella sp.]|nr:hypothetical protein [Prevotella sp.]
MQLPEPFVQQTRQLLGQERFNRYLSAFSQETPVTIRLNPLKCYHMPRDFESRVPWCNTGYYLRERPSFTFDPLLHAGLYYVQEASSMFVAHVAKSLMPNAEAVLDLCAAPGGKSTLLRTIIPSESVLVSNEPNAKRAQVLSENIQKFGHCKCIVTNNYARDFHHPEFLFDLILADVPCSGEGMFRRDPATIEEWSQDAVKRCAALQREIITDIWPCLKPGGVLIYSTCTLNTQENEENVKWIQEHFNAQLLGVDVPAEWNITGSLLPGFCGPVYRFIPGITRGEGLFVAALKKEGHNTSHFEAQQKALFNTFETMEFAALRHLNVLHAGTPEITLHHKQEIPAQALALSAKLDRSQWPTAPLTWNEAVNYLRGEALLLHQDTPKGFVIVTYKDISLGFVKNIGSRANNLYPDAWRIRSTHLPEQAPQVLDI